jgi:hypothetical protein
MSAYDQSNQNVNSQYNASGNINFGRSKGTVLIRRIGKFEGILVKMNIYINNQYQGILRNNTSKKLELDPGDYSIYVIGQDFLGSGESKTIHFSLEAGGIQSFVTWPESLYHMHLDYD